MDALGRLLRDLGGHAGLAALGGHLTQFIRHRAELVGGLLLLVGGLVTGVPAGLAEQVPRLARSLGGDHPGLVGGGLGDVAARLARGLADVGGLVPGDGSGRRLRLILRRVRPCVVSHRGLPAFLVFCVAARYPCGYGVTRMPPAFLPVT